MYLRQVKNVPLFHHVLYMRSKIPELSLLRTTLYNLYQELVTDSLSISSIQTFDHLLLNIDDPSRVQ